MKININNVLKVVFALIAAIVNSNCLADDMNQSSYVEHRYEQFNAELSRLNLSQARSFVEKEEFYSYISFARRVNIDSLRSFYSEKRNDSDADCNARTLCKQSNILFLSALSLKTIDSVIQKKIGAKKIKMGVKGANESGEKIQLSLTWVLEEGDWVIDSANGIPFCWDPFARAIDNITNEKNKNCVN